MFDESSTGGTGAQADHNQPGPRDTGDVLDELFALLDDVSLSPMQRLRLLKELAAIRKDLATAATLKKLTLSKRLAAIRKELGAAAAPVPVDPQPMPLDAAEEIAEGRGERDSTSKFFDFDPDRKPAQRKRDNAQAMAIIARIKEGTLDSDDLSDDDKLALAKYSGTGGNLVGADGKKGSAYEYYTPKPIAEGMWTLLRELGFQGGRVLDPCGGVGIFGATAPVNAAVDAVELNETSGRVNQLVNDGPGYKTTIAPFEQVAAATPDETYDVVISNVPFGEVKDRGGNQFKDEKYRDEPIQNYFILRSLEKLRPGGLAAFITPPRCVSGKGGKEEDLRIRVSYMAEFMGAYRLPNSVFGTAAADTITDVVVFRKYSREVLEKIDELRTQSPKTLIDANVLWQEFVGGTYFVGEGKRFVLGDFVAKDPNKFRDVDRVINAGSMTDIAKLLRKFPGSRVKWDVLEAAETQPLVYREGDTLQHAGNTLQMQSGRWVVIKPAGSEERAAVMAELLARASTPLGAVNSGLTFADATDLAQGMVDAARALEIPDWLRGLLSQLQRVEPAGREAAFNAATVGLAVDQAMEERQAEETGFDYLNGYPILSEAMRRTSADAKKPPTALSSRIKTAMKKVVIHYTKANGFSGVWRGDVAVSVDRRAEAARFEAERYAAGGGAFVPLAQARAVYGEDFDPMSDDDWCVSPDGASVAKADDYYVGNYADFLLRIEREMAQATDSGVRDKLLRQKMAAEKRLVKTDPSSMSFTLFSPFVTLEERAEFLRRFVDPRYAVGFDDKTGEPEIQFNGKIENERDKLLQRYALHLSGTRLTLGGIKVVSEKAAIDALRTIATTAQSQFNSWVKSNPVITGRLHDLANDPQRIYFKQVEDDSPLTVPGIKSDWSPRGFQNAYVRKTGRDFSGINGFGVGLGKTSTALIAVQHAHSIGTKKRTVFVVPNSVVSNWRKEAARVYETTADCLYVGMRQDKKGVWKMDPGAYDADLTKILEGRYPKIFMTYEAFQRLRLREGTAQDYDAYLASVDSTYAASDSKKEDEQSKSLRAKVINQLTSDPAKSAAAPFFEDLGVDSLVIDEGHFLKNSARTIDFKGGKFLSTADQSGRGVDAQAKCWFVRKDSARKDGVILLTATPITNSPLEIYSMLSLAMGHEKLNDLMVGIKGADDFMEVMCQMENRDEETLDGEVKPYDVFVGLNNVDVLRTALAAGATIKDAADVGEQIVMPDSEEKAVSVGMSPATIATLIEYKNAFRFAIDTLNEKTQVGGDPAAYARVAAKFGEPMELIGHPFNLIQKMTHLIADPELDERATFYNFSPAQAAKVAEVVAKFNSKAPIEDRPRLGPHTDPSAQKGIKRVKDGDDFTEVLKIEVRAKIVGDRVVLDTMNAQNQEAFEAIAEKAGVDFDVSIPPKLAALLENVQHEEANPRGRVEGLASGRVRQLIFCDNLAMHTKIKRLLIKKCGVAAASIAIITGKVNNRPEDILEVQDGFNAEGEDNKYRYVIANEKAEVGINLQKGTQAIHHLSLGWTPDSLTQRNGRGLRQGNQTKRVHIYQYDADGTFDTYKRMLVGKKSSWIDSVMDSGGGDTVSVTGGLTREQMEAMIDSVGDADAMNRQQAKAEAQERVARAASTQGKQAVNLATIQAQRQFLKKYEKATAWAAEKVHAYVTVLAQIGIISERLANPKATASALVKNQNLMAELRAREAGLKALIEESVLFQKSASTRYGEADRLVPATLAEFAAAARGGTGYMRREEKSMSVGDRAVSMFIGKTWSPFTVTVSEDGAIGNEWQSEIDMAQSMIDSSKADFERLGGQDGGHSVKVLARAEAGEAAVIDGKVVCAGAFVEKAGVLGVVKKLTVGLQVHYITADAEEKYVSAADELRKVAAVLPGAVGYSDMVKRAAEIEDQIVSSGNAVTPFLLKALFSAVVPEVAQHRTAQIVVTYTARDWFLPSPFFPRVVKTEGMPDNAMVLKKIAAAQSKVVLSAMVEGSRLKFTADSSVAVTDDKPSDDMPGLLNVYCKVHGMKLSIDDVEHLERTDGFSVRYLVNDDRAEFKEVIQGVTDLPELERRMRDWVANEALPFYDLASDTVFQSDPLMFLNRIDSSAAFVLGQAKLRIEREKAVAEALAKNPALATAAPVAAVPPVDGGPDNPSTPVTIIGETKRWKDRLKEFAESKGSRATWKGRNGPQPARNVEAWWGVTAGVWRGFIEAYPAAAQDLQLVKP